jgi:cobalt-zinc-cadmium efflux system outer membrane protein
MIPCKRAPCLLGTLFVATLILSSPGYTRSLHDVVEQVWTQQPEAMSRTQRTDELSARQEASESWTPAPPSMSLAHQTDRVFENTGSQSWETELAIPLWLPGQKGSQQATLDAEQQAFNSQLMASKLRLAGLIRERYWQTRLVDNELQFTQRKSREISRLVAEIKRRVDKGELSTADLSQIIATEQQTKVEQTRAQTAYQYAVLQYQALTNEMVTELDSEATAPENKDQLQQHPYLIASQAIAEKTRRKLKETMADTRESPELSFTLGQAKDRAGEPFSKDIGVKFTLPLSTDSRNRPKSLAASAELTEATVARDLLFRQLQAELDASRYEWQLTTEAEQYAMRRYSESQKTYGWLKKAFQNGQLDLPTYLKTENEKFDAELALNRAQLEKSRAIARYNQAIGVLP